MPAAMITAFAAGPNRYGSQDRAGAAADFGYEDREEFVSHFVAKEGVTGQLWHKRGVAVVS